MPRATDDVEERYILLQAWLYIFLNFFFFYIIWLVFERVDLNLKYVYDIELGYCFSLLVVIECSCYDYMSICHRNFGIYGISQCKIQNVNFKEKSKKKKM